MSLDFKCIVRLFKWYLFIIKCWISKLLLMTGLDSGIKNQNDFFVSTFKKLIKQILGISKSWSNSREIWFKILTQFLKLRGWQLNDLYEKFTRWCPPTQTPTQKLKNGFSMLISQEIRSSLIPFKWFFSSTIWDTQIQFLFTVFHNPKNPGIHPFNENSQFDATNRFNWLIWRLKIAKDLY